MKMDWLRHFLPRTFDFLNPYAPDVGPLTGEQSEIPDCTETRLPASRGAPQGSNLFDSDPNLKCPPTTPDATLHQGLPGHSSGTQVNAANGAFLRNTDHLSSRNSALDGHGQASMKESRGSKPDKVLEKVLMHTIPGAQYNSSTRDPPPRCCPGTRERVLKDTSARIQDKDTRIIWLFGPAGSGKTAIMQTLAETYSPRGICATLFLSRDTRNDPNKIFISLAYDFAVANPAYRRFIGEELVSDPNFLSLSMAEQFRRLFIKPFLNHAISCAQRWVVFLDGLDECRSDTSQCRVIDLIRDSTLLHPEPIPLLWVISGRPEAHLKSSFEAIQKTVPGFWEMEVPVNTQEASKDVELYLRSELSRTSKIYPYSMPSSTWPSEKDVLELANTCSGFFLFASLAMEYISGVNAVSRLSAFSPDHVLDPQSLTSSFFSNSQQEKRLRLMFSQIMLGVPGDVLPCTKAILGYYVLQQVFPICSTPSSVSLEPLDLLTVCNILGIEKHNAFAALLPLSSLVGLPSPEEAGTLGIQFLHRSFPDFLRTSFLHLGEVANRTWHCYLRILRQFKERQGPSGIHICWPASEGNDIQEALFQIARHGWLTLLIKSHYDGSNPKSKKPEIQFSPILNSELADAFKGFKPNLVTYFAQTQIAEFTEWFRRHAPRKLQDAYHHSSDPTYLGNIDMDKVFRARPACCCRIVTSDTGGVLAITDLTSSPTTLDHNPLSADQSQNMASIIGELATVQASHGDVSVKVFRRYSEACAVVGPIVGDDPRGKVYYILPYC